MEWEKERPNKSLKKDFELFWCAVRVGLTASMLLVPHQPSFRHTVLVMLNRPPTDLHSSLG